jgi:hypothetical protein
MTGTEVIKSALRTLQITSYTPLLPERVKGIEATREQLVGIGLVPHVPTHFVPIEIEGLIQSNGEFNDTKPRSKVSTTR